MFVMVLLLCVPDRCDVDLDLAGLGLELEAEETRNGDRGENADDRNDGHELTEGESTIGVLVHSGAPLVERRLPRGNSC